MSNKYTRLRWYTRDKLRLVAESWNLTGDKLGQFLRRNGLHSHDLATWKEQMAMGIDGEKSLYTEERKAYKTKIQKLEKELQEARAIIELQKKVKKLKLEAGAQKQKLKSGKK